MIRKTVLDGATVLTLARNKANALDASFLRAIADAVEAERPTPPRGLVLTAEGSIFSAGLDLPALLDLDRAAYVELLEALHDACLALFTFPRPTVAAINGHAIAGGALLALACDQRLMAQGNGKFGLNEASLGLSIPGFCIEMVRYALERPILEKLLYGGLLYPSFKAHDMRVVDEMVEADNLLESAVEAIVEATPSVDAFADIKQRLHAPAVEAMAAAREDDAAWVDLWLDAEVRARLESAVKALSGGSKAKD